MPTLNGIEKFESKLRDLALTVQRKALVKATKRGGELIREEAASRVERDTGRASEQQILVLRNSENSADEVTVRVGTSMKAFYALFLEIGTAHSTAEPFLGPAFEAKKDGALRVAGEEFMAAIDEVIQKGA